MSLLAILGGTFDPVHRGHVAVALEASKLLDADVNLMPANVPPHRPQPVADAAQRLALLEAAVARYERLHVDARELERPGPSYSVDTLRELRHEEGPQRPIVMLVGADAFAGLAKWHHWRELFDLAHVGVMTRPGCAHRLPAELETEAKRRGIGDSDKLGLEPSGRIARLAVTPVDISATRVRAALGQGRLPQEMMPEGVLEHPELLAPYGMSVDRHGAF